MCRRALAISLAVLGGLSAASPDAGAAPIPCAQLATIALPEATVTAAEDVPAGEYAPSGGPRQTNLPAFCRVALTVSPQIRIEVWLPKDAWNGRYRGEGGGGYAGQVSYGGLAEGIRLGTPRPAPTRDIRLRSAVRSH
jgi:feruloyl esterase